MLFYAIKVLITAILIVVINEVAKSNATLGALIKSLPLISVISMLWIYLDTKNTETIAALSTSTFWLVLPTLPMFLVLPLLLLKYKFGFYGALSIALLLTVILYIITAIILKRFGLVL